MTGPLLQVRALRAGYGDLPVLHGVCMDVSAGEIVAIVGSNGAGKTTLLRALSRVISSTGRIALAGHNLDRLSADEAFVEGLVQVPEGRQLFDRMTVHDSLLMGAFHRRDRTAVNSSIDRVYGYFPAQREHRRGLAGSLSGGEQQMCTIARLSKSPTAPTCLRPAAWFARARQASLLPIRK